MSTELPGNAFNQGAHACIWVLSIPREPQICVMSGTDVALQPQGQEGHLRLRCVERCFPLRLSVDSHHPCGRGEVSVILM